MPWSKISCSPFSWESGPSCSGWLSGPQLQLCILIPVGIPQAQSHCLPFSLYTVIENSLEIKCYGKRQTHFSVPPSFSEFLDPQILSCFGYFPVFSNTWFFALYPACRVLHERSFTQNGWVRLFILLLVSFNRMFPLHLFFKILVISVLEV